MFEIAAYVTTGSVRSKNDDRASVCGIVVNDDMVHIEQENVIAAVIDGVGGELYGNEAAQAVAETVSDIRPEDLSVTENSAKEIISLVNASVMQVRAKDDEHSRASAAISGIIVKDNRVIYFNWGDSKVLLYRDHHIIQKSKDHTLLQQMTDLGIPCPVLNGKTPLTGYLGCPPEKSDEPYINSDIIQKNDIWILCSDGLSDYLSFDELQSILDKDVPVSDACLDMVKKALDNNSDDNISVVLIKGE